MPSISSEIKVLFPHPWPQSAGRTSTLPHLRSGDSSFFFLLSQHLKIWNMSTKLVKHCILVVVSHTKLLAGLDYDRNYLWIVNLSYAREQVVCSLMVKSSWKRSKKESVQCFFGRATAGTVVYHVSSYLWKRYKTNYPWRNLVLTQSAALPYKKKKK